MRPYKLLYGLNMNVCVYMFCFSTNKVLQCNNGNWVRELPLHKILRVHNLVENYNIKWNTEKYEIFLFLRSLRIQRRHGKHNISAGQDDEEDDDGRMEWQEKKHTHTQKK